MPCGPLAISTLEERTGRLGGARNPSAGQHVWVEECNQARAISLPCSLLMRFLISKGCVAQRVSNQFLGKSKKEENLVFFLRYDLAPSFITDMQLLVYYHTDIISKELKRNRNIYIAGADKRCLMGREG